MIEVYTQLTNLIAHKFDLVVTGCAIIARHKAGELRRHQICDVAANGCVATGDD